MTGLERLLRTTAARLAAVYLLIFVLIGGSVATYLFWRTGALLTAETLQTLAAETQGLREQYRAGGRALLLRSIRERSALAGDGLYLLRDQQGKRVAGNLADVPAELRLNQGGDTFFYRPAEPDPRAPPVVDRSEARRTRLAVGAVIEIPDVGLLVVARDIQPQREFVANVRGLLLGALALLVVLGAGTGFVVARNILQRVDQVTIASGALMKGDFSQRLPLNGSGDEFDRLSHSLNTMLARIEVLMVGLREVSDNIAHDLRTPLNRLRIHVEQALRNGESPAELRAALEHTLVETDTLIQTFNALLRIARLEAGTGGTPFEAVDLVELSRDIVELYEPVAEENSIRLSLTHDFEGGAAKVLGDRHLLSQALVNLLDNAMKYGVPCKSADAAGADAMQAGVNVRLLREADRVLLQVADNGRGIPQGEHERVLRRFVRLDESRSEPGSGLGLALVAAIVQQHGGSLTLSDGAPGLVVTLAFQAHSDVGLEHRGSGGDDDGVVSETIAMTRST